MKNETLVFPVQQAFEDLITSFELALNLKVGDFLEVALIAAVFAGLLFAFGLLLGKWATDRFHRI